MDNPPPHTLYGHLLVGIPFECITEFVEYFKITIKLEFYDFYT